MMTMMTTGTILPNLLGPLVGAAADLAADLEAAVAAAVVVFVLMAVLLMYPEISWTVSPNIYPTKYAIFASIFETVHCCGAHVPPLTHVPATTPGRTQVLAGAYQQSGESVPSMEWNQRDGHHEDKGSSLFDTNPERPPSSFQMEGKQGELVKSQDDAFDGSNFFHPTGEKKRKKKRAQKKKKGKSVTDSETHIEGVGIVSDMLQELSQVDLMRRGARTPRSVLVDVLTVFDCEQTELGLLPCGGASKLLEVMIECISRDPAVLGAMVNSRPAVEVIISVVVYILGGWRTATGSSSVWALRAFAFTLWRTVLDVLRHRTSHGVEFIRRAIDNFNKSQEECINVMPTLLDLRDSPVASQADRTAVCGLITTMLEMKVV